MDEKSDFYWMLNNHCVPVTYITVSCVLLKSNAACTAFTRLMPSNLMVGAFNLVAVTLSQIISFIDLIPELCINRLSAWKHFVSTFTCTA